MTIRKTALSDWDEVMKVYAAARESMKLNGNPNQWGGDKPRPEWIAQDIENGNSYVVTENNEICGVFAFIPGIDPTYLYIKGQWLNDEPYGTIHRIAGNGKTKGILKTCLDFCAGRVDNIRIDTHTDNRIMRHLLEKYGFKECGVIYLADGNPRLAFQKVLH